MGWRLERGTSPLEAFPLSIGLLAANVLIFAGTDLGILGERGEALKEWGTAWDVGFSRGQWWRPVTALFLHGGLLHIALNAYALYQLCPALERNIGTARFAWIYFVSGLVGNILSMAIGSPVIGASGSICGIAATYVRFDRVSLGSWSAVRRDPFAGQFLGYLLINIFIGFVIPRVSIAGHLGGAVGGWIAGWAAIPALTGADRGRLSRNPSWLRMGLVAGCVGLSSLALFVPLWKGDWWVVRAANLARQGRNADALAAVERARRAPDPPNLYTLYPEAATLTAAPTREVALALARLAEDTGGMNPGSCAFTGAMLLEAGDYPALRAHLERCEKAGLLRGDWVRILRELRRTGKPFPEDDEVEEDDGE
jgi:rhomboid protease GluP